MALHHATPGEIVNIRPLGKELRDSKNATLLRSEHLQVFRVVLIQGEELSDHAVPGDITVQCLEGLIDFRIGGGKVQRLAAGDLLYLNGGQPHALKALEDASILVTIYHPRHLGKDPVNDHSA
jgi:quercetin dioxygenase-like cupin family protein